VFVKTNQPEELAKEIFWLAWQACGGPQGMGWLQDSPNANKECVWDNIINAGDYPGNFQNAKRPYADYVFGRMMKFGVEFKSDGLEVPEKELRPDYQSWCYIYPTIKDLVNHAMSNLGMTQR